MSFARIHNRTFFLLGFLGLGSLLIWSFTASFFTLAPFIKFLHNCTRMLAVPKGYLWFGLLGLAILAYFLGCIILSAWKQKRALKKYLTKLTLLEENPEKLETAIKKLGIKVQTVCAESSENLAFTYGFIRPTIVVSTALLEILDEDELVAVLLHEICHCQQKDPLKMASVKSLFSTVSGRGPIARLINHFLMTMELRADDYAMKFTDRSWSLASALLKVIQSPNALPEYSVGLITVLDARIERCLNREWMPEPALMIKDKIILAGYVSLLVSLLYFTYSSLFSGFGCHITFSSSI